MFEELMAEARMAELEREYASHAVQMALLHAAQSRTDGEPVRYGWRRRSTRERFASGHSWLKSE